MAVNTAALQKAIDDSGLKETFIAEQKLCISYQAYYLKKIGQNPFKEIEKNVLCETLGLDDAAKEKIFG